MGIRALLIDDEPDIRLVLRLMIEAENGDLSVAGEAGDGDEAVVAVDRLDPTVIVLDERMPSMNGVEAAAAILATRPDQAIVLCSAFLDDALRARAEEAGIRVCVPKGELARIPAVLREIAGSAN